MANQRYYDVRGVTILQDYPEAATQSFKKGDFLTVNTSGQVQIACAAGSRVGAASTVTNRIVGRAEADASGITNNQVPVLLAIRGTQFAIPVYSATPANAYPNQNLLGQNYELYNNNNNASGNFFAVHLDYQTNVKVKDLGAYLGDFPGWPTGANSTVQYGAMWFEFLDAQSFATGGW